MRPPLPAVVALAVLPAAAALAIGRRGALFGGAALAAARAPRARAADADADPSFSRAPSGLLYKEVKPPPPDAARPRAGDTVTCDYTTWRGGFGARLVESSAAAGRPLSCTLGEPGLDAEARLCPSAAVDQALQSMRVGATWRLVVPPAATARAAVADEDLYVELRLRSVALAGPAGAKFGTASLAALFGPDQLRAKGCDRYECAELLPLPP